MQRGTTHIIGAGLAGLAAAVQLSERGRPVVIHELARHAGGRCRSYFETALGLTIDNGNHLILSGNTAAVGFIDKIGSRAKLAWPHEAEFAFCDLASGERWRLRPNAGSLPWWIFAADRRVPGTRATDYLVLARLLAGTRGKTVGRLLDKRSVLHHKLFEPVLLAALNTELDAASADLAGAVIRETLARGGNACRPLFAPEGLGPVLIDPALAFIERRGGKVQFDHALRGFEFEDGRAAVLNFAEGAVRLGADDTVILAVPAWVARTLVPDLATPTQYRAILNAHFKVPRPAGCPRIQGVINGTTEWLFAFDDRLSITVSAADRFNETEREPLARQLWAEVATLAGAGGEMPPWQIVKERRATFAATPAENARRPHAATHWRNLHLAGDWTATGLPATIEGSVRSGETAAGLALRVAA